ncbi:hypothetical protein TNCV_4439891 [Trichonephila clavipes]|nr:hypothetical protein TNCV_4439891 [Trichonephila clavipes]
MIPDFDPKQSDISLYLVIFESQAKRASIEKKEWVGQLLGYNLLPVEILNAVQTRSQVKAAREERGVDSGDAKKWEDKAIIVSSDAENEILIPALQEYEQGTSFTSALTTEFFERFGILVRHRAVYHPQSNSVERFH